MGDRLVRLTRLERALLARLIANVGVPQSRAVLLREVWGYRDGVTSRAVDTAVRRLRRKLEPGSSTPSLLRTIRGKGYVLTAAPPGPALVGRAAELAELARWATSGGPVLIVTGQAGVGKSALVAAGLGEQTIRIDLARSGVTAALDAAATPGDLWLDNVDPVFESLRSILTNRRQRVVITCRYPVDLADAAYLHLKTLGARDTGELVDEWLGTRFGGSPISAADRHRLVTDSGGNPLRLRRLLWRHQGAVPVGSKRHETEGAAYHWGLLGLPPHLLTALRRLAAVDVAVDDESTNVLIGDLAGSQLAQLGQRGLVEYDDGRWSLAVPLRGTIAPDPTTLDALRSELVAQSLAIGHVEDRASVTRLIRDFPSRWSLLEWAVRTSENPSDVATIAIGMDIFGGYKSLQYDSRDPLDRALEIVRVIPLHCRLVLRRVFADSRRGLHSAAAAHQLADATRLAQRHSPGLWLELRDFCADYLNRLGRLVQSERLARANATLAHEMGNARLESSAWMLVSNCQLSQGKSLEAVASARVALAVDPFSPHRFSHQDEYATALAESGRDDEALQVWKTCIEHTRAEGPAAAWSQPGIREEIVWLSAINGANLDASHAELAAIRAHLIEVGTAHIAGVLALYIAILELLRDRPHEALLLLRTAQVRPGRQQHVRAAMIAAHVQLRVPVRIAELPPSLPDGDPRVEQISNGFLALAAGRTAEAARTLAETENHTGTVSRALRRVLRACIALPRL